MKTKVFKEDVVLIIFGLFCILAAVISHLSILETIEYLLAQMFALLLPGLFLHDVLEIKSKNRLVRLFVSYAIGYSLSILLYFVFLLMRVQSYILFFYLPIVFLSFIYIFKHRYKNNCYEETQGLSIIFFFLVLAFSIGVLGYQCNHPSPIYQGGDFIWGDLLFYERNTVAATKGYPLLDLSVSGYNIHYHYFSSLHGAFLHYITGIEIFDICYMAYLEFLFLFVGGAYVLSFSLLKERWLMFFSIVFIVFTAGFEEKTDFYYSKTFLCSFGMTEALGIGMICMYMFVSLYTRQKIRVIDLLLSLLLFSACVGLKALVGCIILTGVGAGCLQLLIKHQYKKSILLGLPYLFVFIIIYIIFIHSPQKIEEDSTRNLTLSATDTILHSGYFVFFYNKLLSHFQLTAIPYIITLIYYFLLALTMPVLLTFLFFFQRSNTSNEVKKDGVNMIFVCMVIISLLLGIFISQVGLSQTYFIRAALPFWFILLLRVIERNRMNRVITLSIYFIACIGVYKSFRLLLPICYNGFNKVTLKNIRKSDYGWLTRDELLGLRWIRDNISADAIITTNKMIEDEKDELGRSRSFATSTYSEHQVYVEGTDFSNIEKSEKARRYKLMKELYGGNRKALLDVKKENVTYIVQFKSIEGYGEYLDDNEIVFENRAIVVYKI